MVYFRQCEMRCGSIGTVAWIPEKFGVKGRVLTLDDVPGSWVVERVGVRRMSEEVLLDRVREYRHHRRVTDI